MFGSYFNPTTISFSYGMVVLLGQALELLIHEGGPEGAEPVSLLQRPVCFPILSQDDGIRIWNCAPSAQEHTLLPCHLRPQLRQRQRLEGAGVQINMSSRV